MTSNTSSTQIVTTEQREQITVALATLNLGRVKWQLQNPEKGEGLTDEEATVAIDRYKQFLFIVAVRPGTKLVPTVDIDDVWHLHVLDTSRYTKDCLAVFGEYLHHTPVLPFDCDDCTEEMRQQFLAETKAAWLDEFGETPELSLHSLCNTEKTRRNGDSIRAHNSSGWC